MFEFVIHVPKIGQLALCVICRLCRHLVIDVPACRDIALDGQPITAAQDLHVCSAQITPNRTTQTS